MCASLTNTYIYILVKITLTTRLTQKTTVIIKTILSAEHSPAITAGTITFINASNHLNIIIGISDSIISSSEFACNYIIVTTAFAFTISIRFTYFVRNSVYTHTYTTTNTTQSHLPLSKILLLRIRHGIPVCTHISLYTYVVCLCHRLLNTLSAAQHTHMHLYCFYFILLACGLRQQLCAKRLAGFQITLMHN